MIAYKVDNKMPLADSSRNRLLRRLAFAFATVSLVGCHYTREPAVFPVAGQVVVNGKPAGGATVNFHPQATDGEVAEARPTGKTDADGRFRLTTREVNDGAPASNYKVTINWAKSDIRPGQPAEDARVIRLLPSEYFLANRTPLTANVKPAPNELATFVTRAK